MDINTGCPHSQGAEAFGGWVWLLSLDPPLPPDAGGKKTECGNNDITHLPVAFDPNNPNQLCKNHKR